jgi:uncharacterized protein (TIGR02147 family)
VTTPMYRCDLGFSIGGISFRFPSGNAGPKPITCLMDQGAAAQTHKRPVIFEYSNYRAFLNDYYLWAKADQAKFSFRYFARIAGFSSSASLKRVIDGERNLSLEAISKFAKALKLNGEESTFFRNLVLLNQAKSIDDRILFAEQLMRSRSFKNMNPLKEFQMNYFARWYTIPIREMVALPDFQEDPHWIAAKLSPSISVADAKRSLDELLILGLLKRDEAGRLVQADQVITSDDMISAALAQFHRDAIRLAGEAIERFDRDEREISAVSLPLAPEALKKAKEIVTRFREEIINLGSQYSGYNKVFQVNLQIFPLTGDLGEGEK